MVDTYDRSRLVILSRLLSFPTINQKDWESDFMSAPKVGDLVSLTSAPVTKFYVSWVVDTRKIKGSSEIEYLLESIDDRSLCWWSNVGFNTYKKDNILPYWKWSDKQFSFNDRWKRVCHGWNNAFIIKPYDADFLDDGQVKLKCYQSYDRINPWSYERTFDNWKKTTMKMMDQFYKDAVIENNKK